jgi:hypothetical protein
MSRNNYAFTVLQATAAVVSLAIIAWSLGFPVLQFAEAANVTTFSNTLSDSTPAVASDHSITFDTPTGVVAGGTIVLTFNAGFSGINSLAFGDLDFDIEGADTTLAATASGADWGVTVSATTITLTSDSGVVDAGDTVTILIGENATGGGANSQITNPSTGSYEVNVTAGSADSGETRVAIVDSVTVTATVDTIFTFTVNGTAAGTDVNGIGVDATGGSTTATTIPFGELIGGTASTAAQKLEVTTNASNGFVVTVAVDQQLTSSNGADIDGFTDGSYTSTPIAWTPPSATLGQENEYGHWGVTSNDTTLTALLNDLYTGGENFVSASTTPVEVFRHSGPADGSTLGTGTADVLFKIEVTNLQEAADDYTATLTYVATPVF